MLSQYELRQRLIGITAYLALGRGSEGVFFGLDPEDMYCFCIGGDSAGTRCLEHIEVTRLRHTQIHARF